MGTGVRRLNYTMSTVTRVYQADQNAYGSDNYRVHEARRGFAYLRSDRSATDPSIDVRTDTPVSTLIRAS